METTGQVKTDAELKTGKSSMTRELIDKSKKLLAGPHMVVLMYPIVYEIVSKEVSGEERAEMRVRAKDFLKDITSLKEDLEKALVATAEKA